MIKSVSNNWPLFSLINGSDDAIDSDVLQNLTRSLDDTPGIEYLMDVMKYWTGSTEFRSTGQRNFGVLGKTGVGRVITALAMANNGSMSVPDGEGSVVVYVLAMTGRLDELEKYVRWNILNNKIEPGVLMGLGRVAICAENPERRVRILDLMREVCSTNMHAGGWSSREAKAVFGRGLIRRWRKTLFPEDPLCGRSGLVDGAPDDWRLKFMWMCEDPYSRMTYFDREDLVKTVDRIKELFPFSLRADMDLNRRDANQIIDGIKVMLLVQGIRRIAMDMYKVEALINAYDRLSTLASSTPVERLSGIPEVMAGLCLFSSDGKGFLKKALSRMSDHGKAEIVLYMPPSAARRALTEVLVILERDPRVQEISIEPVMKVEY